MLAGLMVLAVTAGASAYVANRWEIRAHRAGAPFARLAALNVLLWGSLLITMLALVEIVNRTVFK